MKKTNMMALGAAMLLLAGPGLAQQFEAVHAINYASTEQGKAALGALMKDDVMKGATVTLYAHDFGSGPASHLVVQDFKNYDEYMKSRENRLASHGWARYQLQTSDSEYLGSSMVMVVDDHGKPRHTAGYLMAYLIQTSDAATYRSAIADLGKAVGNPGVLRLVSMRSGGAGYSHAVLIGGKDFKALNEYLDKLFASEAFKEFVARVGDTRKVVGADMYRRVAVWED